MDEEIDRFRDILEVNRTEIVRTIDPDKLFHVLRACRIFDQEDQEEISSQVNYPTLQKRAGRFLDILATKGPNAFDVFCKSLEGTYPHLYKLLTNKEASEFLPVEPDSTCSTVVHEEFSYLAQKYEKLANEKQQLVTRCNKLVNEAVKMRTENERFKKKAEILQYQKALNKNLKKANRDWEEKLYQATEEKYNAVKRSLDYQEATKLAQEKLREALMTIDDMKRELHKAEGEFKLQRTRTTRLQNELNVKPKTHEIDEYKREIRLLKAELTQIRSTQTVRNSMVLECVDERMAILEKEREEARTELKEMVDALYEARQECHAAELQRDQFLEKTEKLEQEIETLQKDCETYLNRKDELWKQLLEREKERNTAIKERDNALRDWTIKTQERDDIFGRFYKLQEKYDTLEQQLRMIRSNTCYMDSESEPSLGNQTPAQNEDESSFSNNIWHRPRSKRLAHRQISVTESAPENEMPDYDVAFADFRAFRSDDDTSLSCKVHPSSSSRRVLESKKIFSSTTEFDQLSFDSSELSDDNVFPLKIKRRHCNRRRKRFRPRSNSCTNLDVDLEKMLHNSSSDGHSSVYSVQSLRTSHNSNTSGYTSIASNTDYFDVLLSDTTMMDIEITGGNSTGIFIKSVKIESRVACDINVGDQVIKIMGKINGQQKKQSFIDLTLEEAVELMNSCSGAMKLTLKHSQVVYEALRYMDTADVRGDSFYVTANVDSGSWQNSDFTLLINHGNVLHVTDTLYKKGCWYARRVDNDDEGVIPNYNTANEILIKQQSIPPKTPLRRLLSEPEAQTTGCFPGEKVYRVSKFSLRPKARRRIKTDTDTAAAVGADFSLPSTEPYTKVINRRPILIVGPEGLVNLVVNKVLQSDMTKDLVQCDKDLSDKLSSKNMNNMMKIDIRKVIDKFQGKHCLIHVEDVEESISMLQSCGIQPFIAVLRLIVQKDDSAYQVLLHGAFNGEQEKMIHQINNACQEEEHLQVSYPKMYTSIDVNDLSRHDINHVITSIYKLVQQESEEST